MTFSLGNHYQCLSAIVPRAQQPAFVRRKRKSPGQAYISNREFPSAARFQIGGSHRRERNRRIDNSWIIEQLTRTERPRPSSVGRNVERYGHLPLPTAARWQRDSPKT